GTHPFFLDQVAMASWACIDSKHLARIWTEFGNRRTHSRTRSSAKRAWSWASNIFLASSILFIFSVGIAEKHSSILSMSLSMSTGLRPLTIIAISALCMWPTPIIFLLHGHAVIPFAVNL